MRRAAILLGSVALAAALGGGAVRAHAREGAPPPCAYEIDAFLDLPERTLDATERVAVVNRGSDPLEEVSFLLGANAYSGTEAEGVRDRILREGAPWLERAIGSGAFGMIEVQSVRLADSMEDLAPGSSIRGTVLRVRLGRAVQPGEGVRLEIHYRIRFPGEALGVGPPLPPGEILATGWYPRLAGPAGEHASYRVRLRLPLEQILGASGTPERGAEDLGDGTRRVFLRADDLSDFVWVSGAGFGEVRREVPLSGGRTVEVVLLVRPGLRGSTAERVLEGAASAIRFYHDTIAPYPHPRLTLVGVPPGPGALGFHPMLATIPARRGAPAWDRRLDLEVLEAVGAQVWERADVVAGPGDRPLALALSRALGRILLEGRAEGPEGPVRLQTGVSSLVWLYLLGGGAGAGPGLGLRIGRGEIGLPLGPVLLDPLDFRLARLIGFPSPPGGAASDWTLLGLDLDVRRVDLPGFGGGFRVPSGAGPEGVIETVERHLGRDAFLDALRGLASQAGDGEGFLWWASPGLDPAVDRGMEAVIRGGAFVDFAVERAETVRLAREAGYRPQERPGDARAPRDDSGGPFYLSRVVVRQSGGVELPVEIVLRFEDGTEARERWDGKGASHEVVVRRPVPLVSAEVDPEGKYALDRDLHNNGRTVAPQPRSVARASAILLYWIQNLLHSLSSVG